MESKAHCNYIIYKATSPAGSSYIGYTKHSLEFRRHGHERHAKKPSTLQNAIVKYGKENIIWEIIENQIPDRATAQAREIYYISKFNTYENGYNQTHGGDGLNPEDYRTKKKISDTLKNGYFKKPGSRLKHSRERGGRPFFVFNKSGNFIGKFETQIDCAEKLNIYPGDVTTGLSPEKYSQTIFNGGYFFSYENKFNPRNYIKPKRKVRAYIKETMELIGDFSNHCECSKSLKINRGQIHYYLSGRLKISPKHPYHFEEISV